MKGRLLLAVLLVVGVFLITQYGDSVPGSAPTPTKQPTASQPSASAGTSSLPPEALNTIALIQSDGPFPYRQDGVVFQNRERRLPDHERGYWHEYTVPTPGESDRGARRIIHGKADEYYYTDDHYDSFTRVPASDLARR